ncbi:myosin regulatory light chain 2a isoform X1 [Clupea harengus]|uniref:Myosin regulatory light chain 2a isoform X1 n=1 Tax=Clupea harengus TaxID=7950 RepID=A0A8M1KUW0_CLUHA|nr:myosin regulatory light chain 2a isoform X1 [Clupea harengus]
MFPPSHQAPKKAKKRSADGANSNVFSMFEQTQIQEFKEAFTIMDQNRDGFIDKNDLRDTFAALGRVNVKQEEIDDMLKEAPGPVNFTVFLTMFGEKLKGADPEDTILNAFKVFDPEGKGLLRKDYVTEMLTTQADRFSVEEVRPQIHSRSFFLSIDLSIFPFICLHVFVSPVFSQKPSPHTHHSYTHTTTHKLHDVSIRTLQGWFVLVVCSIYRGTH